MTARRPSIRPVLLLALAACTSCAAVTLDLSDLDEPVMLSPPPAEGWGAAARPLEVFKTQVSHAKGGASRVDGRSVSEILENEAQMDAFAAIGGHADRVIAVDRLEVYGGGGNLLLVYADLASVDLYGRVLLLGGGEPGAGGDE